MKDTKADTMELFFHDKMISDEEMDRLCDALQSVHQWQHWKEHEIPEEIENDLLTVDRDGFRLSVTRFVPKRKEDRNRFRVYLTIDEIDFDFVFEFRYADPFSTRDCVMFHNSDMTGESDRYSEGNTDSLLIQCPRFYRKKNEMESKL